MVALSSLGGGGGSGSGGSPKVFFNGTLTSADLTGNDTWTVFANDATTTSVIEQITVDKLIGPFDNEGDLVAGDFINDGVTLEKTVNLAGSEVTAPNTSLTIKLDSPVQLTQGSYASEGTKQVLCSSTIAVRIYSQSETVDVAEGNYAVQSTTDELIVKHFDANSTGVVSENIAIAPSTMTNPRWYFSTVDYAYYFGSNGNDQTKFYVANIAGDGTLSGWGQTTYRTYGNHALDIGAKKVYFAQQNSVFQHDLVTNVETTLTTSHGRGVSSTYTTSGAANGVLFWTTSSTYNSQINYYDTISGAVGTISLPVNLNITQDMYFGVTWNPLDNRFYLIIGYNQYGQVYAVYWPNKSITNLGTSEVFLPHGVYTDCIIGDDLGNMFVVNNQANGQMMERLYFYSNTVTSEENNILINGYTRPTQSGGWYEIKTPDATAQLSADDYEVNLKCKVSGTEYKEG
jgi:hypothetical protein